MNIGTYEYRKFQTIMARRQAALYPIGRTGAGHWRLSAGEIANAVEANFKDYSHGWLKAEAIDNLNLEGADFGNAQLAWVEFRNCNLEGANFDNASLDGVSFVGCNLQDASFSGVEAINVRMTNCDLKGVNWGDPRLLLSLDVSDSLLDASLFLASVTLPRMGAAVETLQAFDFGDGLKFMVDGVEAGYQKFRLMIAASKGPDSLYFDAAAAILRSHAVWQGAK
jgi:hypothetical protein